MKLRRLYMGDSSLLSSSAACCGGGQRCQGMAPCLNIKRIQDCFKAGKKVLLYHSLSQRLSVWLLVMRMVVGVDQSVQNKIIVFLLCLEVSQVP